MAKKKEKKAGKRMKKSEMSEPVSYTHLDVYKRQHASLYHLIHKMNSFQIFRRHDVFIVHLQLISLSLSFTSYARRHICIQAPRLAEAFILSLIHI